MTRVAINGFGRIGRATFRALLGRRGLQIVAVNDTGAPDVLLHLLNVDSVHGRLQPPASLSGSLLRTRGQEVHLCQNSDPVQLPWRDLEVDVVVESTGCFTEPLAAEKHLQSGARRVIVSAPSSGALPTLVLGVNDEVLTGRETVVSNASCTTNCLAPMVKVLDDRFGVARGFINTVHAYTSDQRLLDASHRDLRRARAASLSMIPTSTGAAKAVGWVLPHLKGKLDGLAIRVPVPDGSLTDFTATLKKEATVQQINEAFAHASRHHLKGILQYSDSPIVSSDIVGNPHSCIFDAPLTKVMGSLVKVIGWYDNEVGYAHRLADVVEKMGATLLQAETGGAQD